MGKNPEIDLKKLVSNIAIDNDEIEYLDDKHALHLNYGLSLMLMMEFNTNRMTNTTILVPLLKMNNNRTIILEVITKLTK